MYFGQFGPQNMQWNNAEIYGKNLVLNTDLYF